MADMDKHFDAEAKKIAPKLAEMMDNASSGPEATIKERMRSVMEQIIDLLLAVNLAFKEEIDPNLVGVHPDNRHGIGCIPNDVHSLLLLILKQGWVWAEVTSKLVAFQTPPGAIGKKKLSWNEALVRQANGLLAPVSPDTRALTIAGTHTTQCVKAVKNEVKGVPTPEQKTVEEQKEQKLRIWTEHGNIDMSKVCTINPSFAQACERLPYIVIRHHVEKVAQHKGKGGALAQAPQAFPRTPTPSGNFSFGVFSYRPSRGTYMGAGVEGSAGRPGS